MAGNVVIDIDASTKNFESALDNLARKVESTAAQMDKAFSTSGNAEKAIKNTSNAVSDLNNGLKNISFIAAGNVLADGFEKALSSIKKIGSEIYSTTRNMQGMEMSMKALVTAEYGVEKAEEKTKELLSWFKELSLKSPYELLEVMDAFKMNANMGQTVEVAKKTTEAILALGAGLGMGQAEMKRFSAALAQTGSTGKITATDMRQFANNGFGMDKMNKIFDMLSEKYQIAIDDHNDFNKAVADGKITTDDFFEAIHQFAMENYGGAVDAMASTIGGLISSMKDIKTNIINDMFLETSKTISKTLAPYVEYLMKLLTSGNFTKWGENINNWATKALKPLQRIGDMLQNGKMSRALKNLKDFFNGKTINTSSIKIALKEIGGDEFADKWLSKLDVIKGYIDRFMAHKDEIIGALKGIGVAFATAFAVNKINGLLTAISQINPSMVALTALGAAFGLAWTKNLFGVQEKVKGFIESAKNYIGSLKTVYEEKGMSGVWEKLKTDAGNVISELPGKFSEALTKIGAYIDENKGKWLDTAEEAAFDIVEFVFGKSARTDLETFVNVTVPGKIAEYKAAWETGGFSGVWETFSNNAQTEFQKISAYIDQHKADWLAKFEDGIVKLTEFLFDKDTAADVANYIQKLHDEFGKEGVKGVLKTIGSDLGRAILNGLKEIDFVADAMAYVDKLKKVFKEGGVPAALETIGNDLAELIWKGINNIGKQTNTLNFTHSLEMAFDEGGILGLGEKIGEWLRDGIKSVLTNLFGAEDAKTITDGLEFIDKNLFENLSGAVDTFETTLQSTIDKVTNIVDKDTWENAKKTFGVVAGLVAEIAIGISGMIGPAIEGIGDSIADVANFADKVFAFFGKIFDIFQDLYKGDWDKLGEDTVDLGHITERIVESIVQMAENLLMTVTDMIVSGIASIIPGGKNFLETTWNPIMGDYRERQQLRREYGFANVTNAEGVLDYLLDNYKEVGGDFMDDLHWRYDILDNKEQTDALIEYLGWLETNGKKENKQQYTYYREALTAWKDGVYDAFIEPYNRQTTIDEFHEDAVALAEQFVDENYSAQEVQEKVLQSERETLESDFVGWLEKNEGILADYITEKRESGELTNQQLAMLVEMGQEYYANPDLKPQDRYLYEGLDDLAQTIEDELQGTTEEIQFTVDDIAKLNQAQYESARHSEELWYSFLDDAKALEWLSKNDMAIYEGIGNKELWDYAYDGIYALNEEIDNLSENAQSIMLQQQEALPDFDSINLRDGFDRINTALPEASSSVEAFADVVEQAVQRIGGLGFEQSTMYKNSLAGSGTATGRRRVSKIDEFLDKVFGGSESLLPASGVKGSVIEDSFYAIVNSGKEYFVNEAEGLVEEVDRLSHRMDGTGQRNRYMSYMYKSPEQVETALEAFKQMDFATLFADYPIEEDDITHLQELLSTSNESNLTAEQRLADLQAAATSYIENSMNMPEEIRDAFLPILTSKSTNLYQAQEAVSTLVDNMKENKGSGSAGGEGEGTAKTKTVADTFDEIIAKYNSEKGKDKDILGYQLQAMLDAVYLGDEWSGNKSEGRLLLTDLMNGKYNNETYLAAKQAMANGQYSQAIYDAMSKSYTDTYIQALTEDAVADENYQDFVSTILSNIAGQAEGTEGATEGEGGLFGKMFGDPATLEGDFSKLKEQIKSIGEDFSAIMDDAEALGKYLTDTLISEFGNLKDTGVGALQAIGATARSIISDLDALTSAIQDAVDAFNNLNSEGGGNGGNTPNTGGGGKSNGGSSDFLMAGGGTLFPYGTAIVGEHGPEIVRSGSSRLNVFANSQLMNEIAHIKHAFNGLANSAELVSYNRLFGGAGTTANTDNSQHFENHFGAVIGDQAFRDMVDDEVRRAWRREMRLAN